MLLLVITTGSSPVHANPDVAASLTATQPVEAPDAMMRVATQPVEAPDARSQVHSQHTGTGSEEVRPVDQSLTSKKTLAVAATGVSAHSNSDDQHSEPGSPDHTGKEQGEFSDRDTPLEMRTWTRSCLKKPTSGNHERGEVIYGLAKDTEF